MIVTSAGIMMFVRLLQPEKAKPPMLVTVFGIVMLVRLPQSGKAEPPMLVTPSSITTVLISERRSYHGAVLLLKKFVITPVPEMVRVPSSVSVHVRLSPHVPDAVVESRAGSSSAAGSYATAIRTISSDCSSVVSSTVKLPSAVSYPSAAAR